MNIFKKLQKDPNAENLNLKQTIHNSMSENLFDNLARSMAGSLTRREALKLAITGMMGIALTRLGVNTAWASTSCLCSGTAYNPELQCCTPSGIVWKHPIDDLSRCPNRVENLTHFCNPNGCGGAGGLPIPNSFGSASFLPSCLTHDCCYEKCKQDKSSCDLNFLTSLRNACLEAYSGHPKILEMCYAAAATYYQAVFRLGNSFYESAQKQACDCCGSEPCIPYCDVLDLVPPYDYVLNLGIETAPFTGNGTSQIPNDNGVLQEVWTRRCLNEDPGQNIRHTFTDMQFQDSGWLITGTCSRFNVSTNTEMPPYTYTATKQGLCSPVSDPYFSLIERSTYTLTIGSREYQYTQCPICNG